MPSSSPGVLGVVPFLADDVLCVFNACINITPLSPWLRKWSIYWTEIRDGQDALWVNGPQAIPRLEHLAS